MHELIVIHAEWDAEASCWVAEAENLPGLVTGAKTIDELCRKLPGLIQDLLEDDLHDIDVPFEVITRSSVRLHSRAE